MIALRPDAATEALIGTFTELFTAVGELERTGRMTDGWQRLAGADVLRADLGTTTVPAVTAGILAAEQAGRRMDPEHFGVSLAYAGGTIPAGLQATIARRRPGVDPASLVPQGLPGTVDALQEYMAACFSKFVVRPVSPSDDWAETLAAMAEALLPLQR